MLPIRFFILITLLYNQLGHVLAVNTVSCIMGESYFVADCYNAILTVPSQHLVNFKRYKFPAAFPYGTCVVLVERSRQGLDGFMLRESANPPSWLWTKINSGTYRIWLNVRELTRTITRKCQTSPPPGMGNYSMAGPGTAITQTQLLYAQFEYKVTVRQAPDNVTWVEGQKSFVVMGLTEYYVYPAPDRSGLGTDGSRFMKWKQGGWQW
jgi:hypothetical protein